MSEPDEIIVLEPNPSGRKYLRELWNYRELFFVLARRDILVRYKQAFFGVGWALARPLTTTAVFAFAFGKVARLSSGGVPYHLFVLAGALPWQLFASSLSDAGNSVVSNANLVSKTYFPRLIVPASSLMIGLVDFAVSSAVLIAMMLWYRTPFSWPLLATPLFVALAVLVTLGASLWVSALNVRYRDFRHVVPFLVQFGLFVSPVGYSSAMVPPSLRAIYRCNPMVAPIDGLRWCLFGTAPVDFRASLAVSLSVGIALLGSGYLYFKKTESTFADVI